MRTRVAPSTLVGLALAVSIAIASAAVAWLVWTRAEEDARIEQDRAAQAARQALQNSVGRFLVTLRGADGLVDERGTVDLASFRAFARAVTSIPSSGSLALERVVSDEERAAFEQSTGLRIVEFVHTGVFRPAAKRPTYLPIVSVWPQTPVNRALLGVDLLSEPARRRTLTLATRRRQVSFTELTPLVAGQQGFLAFKPLYAPGRSDRSPVGFVSATFGTSVVADVLEQLPEEYRAAIFVDGAPVYATEQLPDGGITRSLTLGGRRWLVTASGEAASHTASYAILLGGLVLGWLLAAFTTSRASFERQLVRANQAEREARERAELLERNASHLAGAVTVDDVAESTVGDLSEAGIGIAAVLMLRGEDVLTLATTGISEGHLERAQPYRLDAETPAAEALRTGEAVELGSGADYDARYPGDAAARRAHAIESLIAIPLRSSEGAVIGALVAASRKRDWVDEALRLVVSGVAEQCAVALERARLHSVERDARRRANILQHLAARLSAAPLPADVAEATLTPLIEAFGADVCILGIVSGEEQSVLWMHRRDASEGREWATLPSAARTVTTQAAAGTPVEVHGERQIAELEDRDAADRLVAQNVTSFLLLPLPDAAGCIGVGFRETRELRVAERALLGAIGHELAQALERATLFQRERDARLRAELMERNAAHLAAASTVAEVASSTVADVEAFGADVVFVWKHDGETLEALASTQVPAATRDRFESYPLEQAGLVTEALHTGALASVGTGDEFDARFPALAQERRALGVESLVAVPLHAARGDVVGALFAASTQPRWLNADRRQVMLGVAEQTGVALERATLFETEREARLLAELLEQNAAHLAAAVTSHDVATSTVADLERAGVGIAAIYVRRTHGFELLAAATGRDAGTGTVAADVIRTGRPIEIESGGKPDGGGGELMLAVPLRANDRRVIGVLEVGSHHEALTAQRRKVIVGVAEQCGLALERAQLQAGVDQAAATAEFLARLSELLERATTVSARTRRLTELLTEERATFAAVHLLEDGALELVASSGSRPAETGDDEQWLSRITEAITLDRPLFPATDDDARASAPKSVAILPLRARGHSLGALTLRAAADPNWDPAISPALAREIASRAAVRIDNALLYERERDVSHSLQLGLLGGTLPSFDDVVVTVAYRAGTETLEVGGDWYDALRLPSGSIALVVGDVVGHGLEAAVAMGQLRGAVSALAQSSRPAQLLEQLDTFVENVPSAATATLAYVELEPATGQIRYACAGHPPPLLVSADGATRFLWEGRSAPLGSMLGEARGDALDEIRDGETLVLYTDGLVERRTESLDAGFERLAASAKRLAHGNLGLADELGDALLEGRSQEDDVCVLTVHRLPRAAVFSHTFPALPAELAGLRERLRVWLAERDVDEEALRSTVLAVSEAASNAVEHGYGCDGKGIVTVGATLVDGHELRVSVRDEGTWRERSGDGGRGRGLHIIEAIVDDVSIDRDDGATVVRMTRSARVGASA